MYHVPIFGPYMQSGKMELNMAGFTGGNGRDGVILEPRQAHRLSKKQMKQLAVN